MESDYRDVTNRTISDANTVNHALIEKALAMRCSSYLSQVKAKLLTDTIFEIDNSKKQLFAINTRLEDEINERKEIEQKLIKARDEAEQATCLKDKFVALVSHDLKNPLNVVMSYLQLLQAQEKLSEKADGMINNALSSCDNMLSLINEILDLRRIKDGKIAPVCDYFNINNVVSEVIAHYQLMANDKGVVLNNEIPENAQIFADQKLLYEVFSNLISNAIKFCHKGGEVRIYQMQDPFVLAVSDTGIGMSPDHLKDLFYYEKKTSQYGTAGERGSGFGLPLSKDIIRAHQGDLQVESQPGKGTTFIISMPGDKCCATSHHSVIQSSV